MGKSPGKWIKTILFGKKSSKSSLLKKTAIEKEATISCKAASGDLASNPSVISDVVLHTTNRIEENTEKGVSANFTHHAVFSLPGEQGTHTEGTMGDSPNSAEVTRQEQAATKAQAAFRGYLARRAFHALKGIIKLQALVRGHLVRRQAIATLRCMQGIVKLQAWVRGQRVRLSVSGLEVHKRCNLDVMMELSKLHTTTMLEKLSENAFIRKLLASSSTAKPLILQYDLVEPNSAWNWLERWSSFQFWAPLPQSKIVLDSKSHRKQANIQTGETELNRPKRGVRKVPAINAENNSSHLTSEYEKPRRNPRKAWARQTESMQEYPQNDLEKVKRNLRKVAVSSTVTPERSEAVTEKPKLNVRKMSSSTAPDVTPKGVDSSSEKINDPTLVVSKDSKQPEIEIPPKSLAPEETVDLLHDDHPAGERLPLETVEKVENIPMMNEELDTKEDQTSKENQRSRRSSFPAKQEYPENVSQNTPTLPSYMAATKSAKAKLRAQGSPMFSQDGTEDGFIRRHSLPTSTNGKLSSISPRVQRLVQANGKGGSKTDRVLVASKDGQEKVGRAGWRR